MLLFTLIRIGLLHENWRSHVFRISIWSCCYRIVSSVHRHWCLERLTHNENDNLAVGVSRTHAVHTSLFANHQISCFDRDQNIANYSVSLLVRNDYDLMTKINKLIRGVLEGGLNMKWQREIVKPLPPEVGDISSYGYTFTPLKVEVFPITYYIFCLFTFNFPGDLRPLSWTFNFLQN